MASVLLYRCVFLLSSLLSIAACQGKGISIKKVLAATAWFFTRIKLNFEKMTMALAFESVDISLSYEAMLWHGYDFSV